MKLLPRNLKIVSVIALFLLVPIFAFGQAISGDIVGTVKDNSGAVVGDASVDATNLGTGFKTTVKTNSAGEFHFVNLPGGHYSVKASGAGLAGTIADVEVQLNHTVTANVVATPTSSTTTVEVNELAAAVDTVTATISNTFETKQTQDLPTASVGLGVLNLSLLNAGVTSSGGVGAGTGPSISGQRPRNNNFTIEGVDNNDKSVTGPLVTVPNDAVENFTVLQNNFSAEFGHSSGGQFNQTIKSGTNSFHGKLYEYFQNRNLNAMDSLVAQSLRSNSAPVTNPRFDDNRFGGQIGGPIIKNKLFFFSNFQYEPLGQVGSASVAYAPTAAGYATLNALYPNSVNLQTLQKYLPAAATNDQGMICAAAGCAKGAESIPIGSVGFSGPSYSNTLTSTNAIDFNISQKDQLRGRYIYEKQDLSDTAAQIPTFFDTLPVRYHLFTLSEYHTFSPSVSNELRLGYNRYYNVYAVPNTPFPGLAMFPNLTFDDLNGVNVGPDPNAPQGAVQNTYQAVDNVSWVKGKHSLKFGVEFRDSISPQQFTQRVRGDYDYSNLALFAADGAPDTFGERSTGDITYYGNQKAVYGYGADTWRVMPTLSLDFGLRYEFTQMPLSAASLQSINSIASVPGLITFGTPTTQKKNFMPRLGFAWDPTGSGSTSVRGGYAMANDVLYDNLGILAAPAQLSQTCDTTGAQGGGCTWSTTAFLANGGLPSQSFQFPDAATARTNTSAYVPNQKLPYSETWNLGIQHSFGQKYVAEVRYVGTRGIHLPVQTRLNAQSVVNSNNYLPTYLQDPGLAVANSLPLTLADLQAQVAAGGNYVPGYFNAGFNGAFITSFQPYGQSIYHGLQTQLSRNFSNGLQFQLAYTWSHAEDNSTADVFSTFLTPRRPQDFQNFAGDMGTSALDRRHRFTAQVIYDLPFFKSASWFKKNMIGNWELAPVYTFQSPEYATVQSGVDSNMNGDSAGDRAIYNPAGVAGTGSGVTPLKNSAGDTVGYVAVNPNAQYIQAQAGALATISRNTLALPHINNWDMTIVKRLNITERQSFEFQAQALNVFNHAQYVPGYLNQVNSLGYTGGEVHTMLEPQAASFNKPNLVFSNQPRTLQLVVKYSF